MSDAVQKPRLNAVVASSVAKIGPGELMPAVNGTESPRSKAISLWDSVRSVSGGIWIAVFIISAVLLVGAFLAERQQRNTNVADVELAAQNLARSLALHADGTLELIDFALLGLRDRIEAEVLSGEGLARITKALRQYADAMPRVRSLSILDEAGEIIATSLPPGSTVENSSNRGFFRRHAQNVSAAPFIGPSVESGDGGASVITASRRISGADGSFRGVALATLDVRYFSHVYGRFQLGQHGSVSLLNREGVVLARGPHVPGFIGRDLSKTPLFTEHLPRASAGSYRLTSPVDGIPKIAGYQAGVRFPIVLFVAMGEEEALANWHLTALIRVTAVMVLVALIWLLALLLTSRLARLRRVQEAIATSEANFRSLAENAGDVVAHLGPDWVVRYISPAAASVLKRDPDQIAGLNAISGLEPSRQLVFQQAAESLANGETDAVTLTYPTVRGDGSSIWLETTFRSARDQRTGEHDGVVTISRDVTARHLYEQQLAALATTDALTGLANRRSYNEALVREWGRATRENTPLSMVMIDLDRFKHYNDTYGHTEGDAALFAVAAAISEAARRPGDIAARYGGEELALILPGTDRSGAVQVAERARAAVQSLALPHQNNPPAEVVTISCGVATLDGDNTSRVAGPAALAMRADEALYRAKHRGRNRVCVEEDQVSTLRRVA